MASQAFPTGTVLTSGKEAGKAKRRGETALSTAHDGQLNQAARLVQVAPLDRGGKVPNQPR